MDAGTALSVAIGVAGAVAPFGIPALVWVHSAKKDAEKAVQLLEGREEFEGDGVIPRLRETEQRVERVEQAIGSTVSEYGRSKDRGDD